MARALRIGIVAGEPSGDLLGAALIRELSRIIPQCEFIGVAGEEMCQAGAKTLFPMEDLSVMGFSAVLLNVKKLLSRYLQVKNYFLKNPPDIYIGIDSPDFNLPIEKVLKKNGIKTVHYNSPTIWAWRENRIDAIKKSVDLMLTLFPFENKFYEKANIPAHYIGHPLADMIAQSTSLNNDIAKKSLMKIALLPGSRSSEIKYIAPVLLKSAGLLLKKYPEMTFYVPLVNQHTYDQFQEIWKKISPELNLQLSLGRSRQVMQECDLVILASGTAALEAMLLKRPMIVVYKSSYFSYWIAKKLVKIKNISLPNILAENKLVPELLQAEATPENIVVEVEQYLMHPEKIYFLNKEFTRFHEVLRCHAAEKAAGIISQMLI